MKPSIGMEVRGRVQELRKSRCQKTSYRYFRINEMGGIEVLSYASFFLTVDQNYQEREKRKESEKKLDLRNRTEVEFRKFELVRM